MTPVHHGLALACAIVASGPATADIAMLSYHSAGRVAFVAPVDVFDIEVSESGGITDIFIRLFPSATQRLTGWAAADPDAPLNISICDAQVLASDTTATLSTGTLYVPNLRFVQADALRSVWQGRETCATLSPEVFSIGQ